MKIQMLDLGNIDMIAAFEQEARRTEADIFLEDFDADKFRKDTESALKNPAFSSAHCMMCVDDTSRALGRIDFAITASYAFGGSLQAYVDWVYVLKEFRHRGVARFLLAQMAAFIKNMGAKEYFLVVAGNEEAERFYHSLEGADITICELLKMDISR